jgi:hypothetical protein
MRDGDEGVGLNGAGGVICSGKRCGDCRQVDSRL